MPLLPPWRMHRSTRRPAPCSPSWPTRPPGASASSAATGAPLSALTLAYALQQGAPLARGGPALHPAPPQPHPDRQREQHHREAEQQILDRRVRDPPPENRRRVVDDDAPAGQDAVRQQLKTDDDRVRGPEHRAGHQPGTQHDQVDGQRPGHPEQRRDRVRHSSPAGSRSTARTASKPRIAHTGTTRKNSTSSNGRPPGSTMPVICERSNRQWPAAIASRSQITKTHTTGSSVSSSRRPRRKTFTLRTGSSQIAAARQPTRTSRYA